MRHRRFAFPALHLLTWLVLLGGIACVVLMQRHQRRCAFSTGNDLNTIHGWPAKLVTRSESGGLAAAPSEREVKYKWKSRGILVNTLVGGLLVFSVAFTTEKWLRSESKFRWGLASTLLLFGVFAATLATAMHHGYFFGLSLHSRLGLKASVLRVRVENELPWYFQFFVVLGLACTFYAAVSVSLLVAKRAFGALREYGGHC